MRTNAFIGARKVGLKTGVSFCAVGIPLSSSRHFIHSPIPHIKGSSFHFIHITNVHRSPSLHSFITHHKRTSVSFASSSPISWAATVNVPPSTHVLHPSTPHGWRVTMRDGGIHPKRSFCPVWYLKCHDLKERREQTVGGGGRWWW